MAGTCYFLAVALFEIRHFLSFLSKQFCSPTITSILLCLLFAIVWWLRLIWQWDFAAVLLGEGFRLRWNDLLEVEQLWIQNPNRGSLTICFRREKRVVGVHHRYYDYFCSFFPSWICFRYKGGTGVDLIFKIKSEKVKLLLSQLYSDSDIAFW